MPTVPHGIRSAFEAHSWGRTGNDFVQAWALLDEAVCRHLDLVDTGAW
jgi:hypothetical protein